MIKKGDKVKVDYEGRFEDGEVFDSSNHGDHSHPLGFEVGAGDVIKGFDEAVMGLNVGDEKEFTITPEEGYGNYDERLVQKVPLRMMPKGAKIEEGMEIMMRSPDGHAMPVRVKKIVSDMVELDLNHPMAGKTMIFKIKVVSINAEDDSEEEHHH